MKTKCAIVIFLLAICGKNCFSQEADNVFQMPDVTIQKLDGSMFMTKYLQNDGNPFILCFWKTCCRSTVDLMEALSEIYDDLQSDYEVRIFAISIDDARSSKDVKPFVNGNSWDFDIFLDPNGDFKRRMNVVNTPYTYIFDGEGNIAWQKAGYGPGDENIIEGVIDELSNN